MLYRRFSSLESLGFNYRGEGVVTDVLLYKSAWRCGLRQGCRIVEVSISKSLIFKVAKCKLGSSKEKKKIPGLNSFLT